MTALVQIFIPISSPLSASTYDKGHLSFDINEEQNLQTHMGRHSAAKQARQPPTNLKQGTSLKPKLPCMTQLTIPQQNKTFHYEHSQ